MGRKLIFFAVIFLAALPAFAQDGIKDMATVCRQMVNHQADADVAYTPGIDARGNAVAPADLDGGAQQLQMPETIRTQITQYQADRLGLLVSEAAFAEAYVGEVSLRPDGSVFFNDQRLSQPQVQVLCDKNATTP